MTPHAQTSSPASVFHHSQDFYGPVILNPSTFAEFAFSDENWRDLLSFHSSLVTDEYVAYLDAYYREGRTRFGRHWRYMDIVVALHAAASLIKPKTYLEIGVRRGRSVCTVARACPQVHILAFDMWQVGYAGMENPGPEYVKQQLSAHGHVGTISFVNGNSHETVPQFFSQHPTATFDLITVDGDHSDQGALDDLMQVIPRLSVGGIVVFDDIAHPLHPGLRKVWDRAVQEFRFLTSCEFTELGYGVGVAIRRGP